MLRFGALRPTARRGSGEPLSSQIHLRDIHALVAGLIREFAPDGVAIESVFTALNIKTALRLAEVRGVILLAAAQAGVASFSYSPREVKATVAGYGNAGKEQVQQMVRAVLGMSETPEPPDASDALAVALCHVQMAESQQRIAAQSAVLCSRAVSRRRNRAAVPRVPSLS
jgi:crossover junction endodeoxyribonuclease RuvC